MKQSIRIIILFFISGNSIAQTYPSLMFKKPASFKSASWRFNSKSAGVDAKQSIVKFVKAN